MGLASRPAEEQESRAYTEVIEWYGPMLQIALRSGHGSWVDAGCGHGYVTEFLKRKGVSAIGVDMDLNQLKSTLARDLCVVADIQSLPFKDDSINGIIAFEVLEHLPKPLKAVAEFHRVLKRGGALLTTTPTPRSSWAGYRGHTCVKPRGAWISALRQRGFKINVVDYGYRLSLGVRLPTLANKILEFVLMLYKPHIGVSGTKLQCFKK